MNTDEMLRLINERCDQMIQILNDHRMDPDLSALTADVMEPILREIYESQEQLRTDAKTAALKKHPEPSDQ